ncbi:MAG: hypothetical protein JSS53_09220 [Proteobacteria bacterium]|nr:hypothetical protein [Pseudomonadota bacterium]
MKLPISRALAQTLFFWINAGFYSVALGILKFYVITEFFKKNTLNENGEIEAPIDPILFLTAIGPLMVGLIADFRQSARLTTIFGEELFSYFRRFWPISEIEGLTRQVSSSEGHSEHQLLAALACSLSLEESRVKQIILRRDFKGSNEFSGMIPKNYSALDHGKQLGIMNSQLGIKALGKIFSQLIVVVHFDGKVTYSDENHENFLEDKIIFIFCDPSGNYHSLKGYQSKTNLQVLEQLKQNNQAHWFITGMNSLMGHKWVRVLLGMIDHASIATIEVMALRILLEEMGWANLFPSVMIGFSLGLPVEYLFRTSDLKNIRPNLMIRFLDYFGSKLSFVAIEIYLWVYVKANALFEMCCYRNRDLLEELKRTDILDKDTEQQFELCFQNFLKLMWIYLSSASRIVPISMVPYLLPLFMLLREIIAEGHGEFWTKIGILIPAFLVAANDVFRNISIGKVLSPVFSPSQDLKKLELKDLFGWEHSISNDALSFLEKAGQVATAPLAILLPSLATAVAGWLLLNKLEVEAEDFDILNFPGPVVLVLLFGLVFIGPLFHFIALSLTTVFGQAEYTDYFNDSNSILNFLSSCCNRDQRDEEKKITDSNTGNDSSYGPEDSGDSQEVEADKKMIGCCPCA